MDRIEPTRLHALRILWAVFWRSLLVLLGCAFAMGAFFALLSALLGLPESVINVLIPPLAFLLSIGAYVEMTYRVLRKRFKDFEIALVPRRE